jgi:glyoxylase-like metal-dependent hydrolase (beta-lactamase superfamily II)/rhodanese-related sulfurtransferase
LAEFAYYIESNGEAAIIDPLRDIQVYLDMAKKNNVKIKYVLETHFHADFVSGHLDIAKATGAQIIYGPGAVTKYTTHVAKDGEELKLGDITLKVLHTPGHTLESSCYLLLDQNRNPYSLFTGDTLFLGEVGRPDLAVKGESITKEDLAGMLFDSLTKKIMPLPDDVIIYPAHGAGSSCGKSISRGKSDKLGNQKKMNYALKFTSRDEFVKVVAADLPTPPKYFFLDAFINKEGYTSIDELLKKNNKPLKLQEFEKIVKDGATILDCREGQDFTEGHIPNSVNIPLTMPFAVWVGNLFDAGKKIVLVCDPGKEQEALIRLARVGYENVEGYLDGGIEGWMDEGHKLQTLNILTPSQFKEKLDQSIEIIDVRNPEEWKLGIVKGAKLISLNRLEENLGKLNKDQPYYLYCKAGMRSHIAYTIMQKEGFKSIYTVQGGLDRIMREGVDLVPQP